MKKLTILLAVFILASGFIFAQEEEIEFFNLEVAIGFPVHWTNGSFDLVVENVSDKAVTANTSIGLGMNFNFTRKIGVDFDLDVFYGAKLTGFSATDADHTSLFGFNVFLGPVFYLFNNNQLRIPFTAGVHFYYFTEDVWEHDVSATTPTANPMKITDMQFGLGFSLGVQYHFSRDIYIFSKTSVALDIIRMLRMKGYDGSAVVDESYTDILPLNWLIKPSIGIGIKF